MRTLRERHQSKTAHGHSMGHVMYSVPGRDRGGTDFFAHGARGPGCGRYGVLGRRSVGFRNIDISILCREDFERGLKARDYEVMHVAIPPAYFCRRDTRAIDWRAFIARIDSFGTRGMSGVDASTITMPFSLTGN